MYNNNRIMNYQEFLSEVRERVAERMEPETRLKIHTMPRNNGTSYDGLVILQPGRNISPTIYLTPYYHRYLEGVCMEDIYDDIVADYEKHLPECDFDTELFTDFEKVKSRLVMRLVNFSKNEVMLSDVPYYRFYDLAVVFYCLLHADDENQASIMIHHEHLQMWGIDEDTLYELARENTPRLLPYRLDPMQEILEQNFGVEDLSECGITMYVLSNSYRTNGATAILYEQVLQDIARELDSGFIILPSSIHEVILLPAEDASGLQECNRMVREVNETQLADDEVLADHAYYYDRHQKMIVM